MKKVAVIPAVVLAALCTFTGCKKEEVEKVIAPLVSDGQTTESTECIIYKQLIKKLKFNKKILGVLNQKSSLIKK